jgi:hypothetical protein
VSALVAVLGVVNMVIATVSRPGFARRNGRALGISKLVQHRTRLTRWTHFTGQKQCIARKRIARNAGLRENPRSVIAFMNFVRVTVGMR